MYRETPMLGNVTVLLGWIYIPRRAYPCPEAGLSLCPEAGLSQVPVCAEAGLTLSRGGPVCPEACLSRGGPIPVPRRAYPCPEAGLSQAMS